MKRRSWKASQCSMLLSEKLLGTPHQELQSIGRFMIDDACQGHEMDSRRICNKIYLVKKFLIFQELALGTGAQAWSHKILGAVSVIPVYFYSKLSWFPSLTFAHVFFFYLWVWTICTKSNIEVKWCLYKPSCLQCLWPFFNLCDLFLGFHILLCLC